MISRTSQVLLSFLAVRIIVNNKEIYPLLTDKPVVIPVEHNFPKIVATDGFHYTKPLELKYEEPIYYPFKVSCAIDVLQLLGGSFLLNLKSLNILKTWGFGSNLSRYCKPESI